MLVAMLAMSGLSVDGGSAFAQRRGQQNAADLAALAAGNTYLIAGDAPAAQAAALTTASRNGYTNGTDNTSIGYSLDTTVGASITVTVNRRTGIASGAVVGMREWPVSATATAVAGYPDTAYGGGGGRRAGEDGREQEEGGGKQAHGDHLGRGPTGHVGPRNGPPDDRLRCRFPAGRRTDRRARSVRPSKGE